MRSLLKLIFIAFNLLMAFWFISTWFKASADFHLLSHAEQTGTVLGLLTADFLIAFFWATGDVILGLPLLLMRRDKT